MCGRAAPPGDRWRPSPPAGIGWALWAWFGGGGLEVGTTGETSTDSSVPERNICRNLLEDDSTVRGTMCGTFFELFLNYMRNFFELFLNFKNKIISDIKNEYISSVDVFCFSSGSINVFLVLSNENILYIKIGIVRNARE